MVARRGKVVRTDGVDLPKGRIKDMQHYKYPGIPQATGDNNGEANTPKYLQKVRQREASPVL